MPPGKTRERAPILPWSSCRSWPRESGRSFGSLCPPPPYRRKRRRGPAAVCRAGGKSCCGRSGRFTKPWRKRLRCGSRSVLKSRETYRWTQYLNDWIVRDVEQVGRGAVAGYAESPGGSATTPPIWPCAGLMQGDGETVKRHPAADQGCLLPGKRQRPGGA